MLTGTQVQNKSTGEQGVVLEADGGSLVKVAFASGIAWLSPDELQGAPEGPEDRLIKGRLGSAESYALRLQALYLKHAYRYDPLTGLSSADRTEAPPSFRSSSCCTKARPTDDPRRRSWARKDD